MSAITKTLAIAALSAAGLYAAAPAPVAAQERVLTIFGDDECPRDTICVRAPENERYRIPKELRETTPQPGNESWAARARSMEYVGRTGINSCSPVGAGGWTGCYEQMVRQAREERRQAAAAEPEY